MRGLIQFSALGRGGRGRGGGGRCWKNRDIFIFNFFFLPTQNILRQWSQADVGGVCISSVHFYCEDGHFLSAIRTLFFFLVYSISYCASLFCSWSSAYHTICFHRRSLFRRALSVSICTFLFVPILQLAIAWLYLFLVKSIKCISWFTNAI